MPTKIDLVDFLKGDWTIIVPDREEITEARYCPCSKLFAEHTAKHTERKPRYLNPAWIERSRKIVRNLQEYVGIYGRLPERSHPMFGRWLQYCRSAHRKGQLDPSILEGLEALPIVWNPTKAERELEWALELRRHGISPVNIPFIRKTIERLRRGVLDRELEKVLLNNPLWVEEALLRGVRVRAFCAPEQPREPAQPAKTETPNPPKTSSFLDSAQPPPIMARNPQDLLRILEKERRELEQRLRVLRAD